MVAILLPYSMNIINYNIYNISYFLLWLLFFVKYIFLFVHNIKMRKIRYFRQQRKLTQEQLALGAEINPVFLGHLERNLKSPTITTLEKITRALGITMSELFLDVPNNNTDIEVRQASIQHINYLLKDLSNEELDKITGILKEIIDWKTM